MREFWRDAIVLTGDGEESLQDLHRHAYPDIEFYPDVLGGVRRLGGGYRALRREVQRTLEVLDDYGTWAFTFPPPSLRPEDGEAAALDVHPTNKTIQERFRGFGIVIAPENPDVFKNGMCRRAREVTIGSTTLYCEWHVKLEPHRNRIHVHPPVEATGRRVLVAIVDEHLPLP